MKAIGFLLGKEKPFDISKWTKDNSCTKGNLYNGYNLQNKLPNHNIQCTSYWIARLDGERKFKLATIKLRDNAIQNYPIFKMANLSVTKGKQSDYELYLNMDEPVKNFDNDYIDFEDFEDSIRHYHPEKFTDNPEELIGTWGILQSQISKISITRKGILMTTQNDLNIWFQPNTYVDIDETPDTVYFIVSIYKKEDDSLGINGLGYWVEEEYRLL